ncbi:MAG: 4Fe-4S dicluster domain-containing protein [Spirochaetes bacterium]|nr:4Fe-4S dicluster domain-containing protein [Spirochaetota bacterium]
MQKDLLVEKIRAMGVVGAGGAGFPTHVKFNTSCEVFIVNGAECEPLLASDKYLLEKETNKLIKALEIIRAACQVRHCVIAVKEKNINLVNHLASALKGKSIDLFLLKNFYPAGDEQVLVHEITGKVVPEGAIPLKIGCVVSNVETIKNIYDAVKHNHPVISRYLTCTGEVKNPSIIQAKIGMSIRDIMQLCGGVLTDDPVVLIGGPLMGYIEKDLDAPVTKLTSGVIILAKNHPLVASKTKTLSTIIRQSKAACCQCTYCTELCPRYLLGHNLEPHKIMRQINLGLDIPENVIENAQLCSECGLCEAYACIMNLSPRMVNQTIKKSFVEKGFKPQFSDKKTKVREMRDYRKIPSHRLLSRLQLANYKRVPSSKFIETHPKKVELLLTQHIGVPAQPLVKINDRVAEGDLVAEIAEGKLGARHHASISGKVILVDEERIIISQK